MSKLGSNIRTIAGYEKLLKLVREAQDTADQAKKLSIENKKSISYLDNKTLTTANQPGTTGQTQPNGGLNNTQTAAEKIGQAGGIGGNIFNAGTGTSLGANSGGQANANSQSSPLNGAGKMGSSDDLGGDDNSEKEGNQDAESALNNESDPDSGGKAPVVPSGYSTHPQIFENNQYTGEKTNAWTGLKTEAGRQLVVRLGSIGAIAWVGPDDWDDAFNGPEDPTFDAGKVWRLTIGSDIILGSTFSEMIANAEVPPLPNPITKAYGISGGFITNIPPIIGEDILFSTNFTGEVGQPSGPLGGTVYAFEAYIPTDQISNGHYGLQDCGLVVGDSTYCVATAPRIGIWTDLGVTQLGWISGIVNDVVGFSKDYIGRFMPHPADVNVPSEFVEGASILDLLTTKNEIPVRIGPLKEGGFYLYERDPEASNAPVGSATENSVLIIRTNGTSAGFITPNQLSTMLP